MQDRACYRGPPTFTKEEGQLSWQSLLKILVLYALFFSLKPWKCHNNDRWISFLFWVVCLAAPINLPTASTFYSKCACSSESLGDIAETNLRSVINPKEYIKITYFYSGADFIAKWCYCFIEQYHCEELIITHTFKKFPIWMALKTFITMFTTSHHWTLSWASWIQSMPYISLKALLIFFPHLFIAFPNGLFILHSCFCCCCCCHRRCLMADLGFIPLIFWHPNTSLVIL